MIFPDTSTLPDLLPMKRELTEERYESYNLGLPYTLEICPSYKCQLRCKYCYAIDGVNGITQEMDFKLLKKLLLEASKLGVKEIGWLGGEPLLYGYFWEAVEFAHELGLKNNLRTNGLALNKLNDYQISMLDLVRIHIDTHDYNDFKKIMGGGEIGHKSILQSIHKFNRIDSLTFQVGIVVSSLNISNLNNWLFKLLNEWEVSTMLLRFRASRSAVNEKYLEVSDKDYHTLLEYYYELMGMTSFKIPPNICSRSSIYCKTEFFVDYDFTIQACDMVVEPRVKYNPGNLKSLYKQHFSKFRFEEFNPKKSNNCGSCEFNDFCFGCRASAQVYGGGIENEDPSCLRVSNQEFS